MWPNIGLITILGEYNFTSQFLCKKRGGDSRKSILWPLFGHVMAKFGHIWVHFLVRPRHESPSAKNVVFVLGVLVGVVVIRFSIP